MADVKDCSDPCQDWIIGGDKELIFQKAQCLATDNRLIWDYGSGLLTIDGSIAVSGIISTSSQVEAAFLSPQALGLGSLNFTPESGYGGLVYSGGPIFYYWNDLDNAWEQIDFSSHVKDTIQVIAGDGLSGGGRLINDVTIDQIPESTLQLINVNHNGNLMGTKSTVNFQDSVSVSWEIDASGNISVSGFGTGGGQWIADVNANGFCINNLGCINGVPIQNFLTSVWSGDVNANGFNLYYVHNLGVDNLAVGNEFIYQNKTFEQWLLDSGLWTLAPDGSIYRNSDVYISGTGETPLEVTTSAANNYLFLDSGQYSAFAAKIAGKYAGELGFSDIGLELWAANSLVMQADDATGNAYFPSKVGIGSPNTTGNMFNVFDTGIGHGIAVQHSGNDSSSSSYYSWKDRTGNPVQNGDWLMDFVWGGYVVGFYGNQGAIQAQVSGADGMADILFLTNDGTNQAGAGYERMRITSKGDIGFGGTPVSGIGAELFHGELRISGSGGPSSGKGIELWYSVVSGAGIPEGGMENYNYDLGHYEQLRFQGNPVIINAPWEFTGNAGPVPGYVGIGTEHPAYKLDVAGDINCSGNYRIKGQPLVAFIQDVVKRTMRKK